MVKLSSETLRDVHFNILRNLDVFSILNFCKTKKKFLKIGKSNKFWFDYSTYRGFIDEEYNDEVSYITYPTYPLQEGVSPIGSEMAILVHHYLHHIKDVTFRGVFKLYTLILSILESKKEYEDLYYGILGDFYALIKDKKIVEGPKWDFKMKKGFKRLYQTDIEEIGETFSYHAEMPKNLAGIEYVYHKIKEKIKEPLTPLPPLPKKY